MYFECKLDLVLILNFHESVFAMYLRGQKFNLSLVVTIITLFLQESQLCLSLVHAMLILKKCQYAYEMLNMKQLLTELSVLKVVNTCIISEKMQVKRIAN